MASRPATIAEGSSHWTGSISLWVVVLVGLVAIVAVTWFARQRGLFAAQPGMVRGIVIVPTVVNLQDRPPGEIADVTIEICNHTRAPIQVWGIQSTCRCLAPVDELVENRSDIAPGSRQSVRFQLKVGTFEAEHEETVDVYVGGNELSTLSVPVRWRVKG